MNKKSTFFACLIVLSLVLVLTLAAGCARPKPEPKLTPTVTVVTTGTLPQASVTVTPAPAQTQAAAEPTVVTTKPGAGTPLPTTAPATAGSAAASPTPVVIATVPASSQAGPTAEATAATAAQPTPAVASGEQSYTVALGDTLTSIAQRFGTTVAAISSLNNISRPDQIYAGMKLTIPAGASAVAGGATSGESVEYIVQVGDNMGSIAVKFDVTVEAILKANNLSNPDFLYAGQKLIIPKGDGSAPASDGTPKTHVVKAGETLASIASKYGVTVKAITDANNLANSNLIYPGQTLRIP